MKFNSFDDKYKLIENFKARALTLCTILIKDEDFEVKLLDVPQMVDIAEHCHALHNVLRGELYLGCYSAEIMHMVKNDDEYKFFFVAERNLREFIKKVLMPNIAEFLDFARNFKFKDYRAQKFQADLCGALEKLQNRYKEILGNWEEVFGGR